MGMQNRCTIHQKSLMNILSSMQPICTKRTTLEATSSILFEMGYKEMVLKATDMEISLQSSYIMEDGSIEQPCSFLVPGKRIFDIVKELEGTIDFYVDGQQVNIKTNSIDMSLRVKDAQEFPPFPERIENLMQLATKDLLELLNSVAFLVPQNNANPALNGLLVEFTKTGLTMTTTDGHCLAQASSKQYVLEEPKTWLLPRRAIFELKKLLEGLEDQVVFIGICGNQVVFSATTFNFFTRLLVDPFPSYGAVLQRDGFSSATVDRNMLIKALRRSSCLLSGQFIPTRFAFTPEHVDISIVNKEVGSLEERVPLMRFDGGMCDIRFYAPYMLNGLQVFTGDQVDFMLKGPQNPIIFTSVRHDFQVLYLVMPISPTHVAQY